MDITDCLAEHKDQIGGVESAIILEHERGRTVAQIEEASGISAFIIRKVIQRHRGALTPDDVRAIRTAINQSVRWATLTQQYRLSLKQIADIRAGRLYGDVPPDETELNAAHTAALKEYGRIEGVVRKAEISERMKRWMAEVHASIGRLPPGKITR